MMNPLRLLAGVVLALALTAAGAAQFPNSTFKTDDGPLKLETLRGKVVYVDYWASWCAPCRRSFPWMNEMQTRYRDRGLVIVAVNVDVNAAAARRFLKKRPADFRIAYDPDGASTSTLNLIGMPTSFLLDRGGAIVSRHVGFRDADKKKREAEIRDLLNR